MTRRGRISRAPVAHSSPSILLPPRQADWSIVQRGWEAHVLGKAPHQFTDALTAVKTLRVRA